MDENTRAPGKKTEEERPFGSAWVG